MFEAAQCAAFALITIIKSMNKNQKTEEDYKKELTPEEYRVLREKGTESAFSGEYWDEHAKGMYRCRACGEELFSSETKFDSGTGWPSFTEPFRQAQSKSENVELKTDSSHGMRRTEVICKNCGSHLGHVFEDSPKDKGGKRFCINSCSLKLEKKD